MTVLTNSAEGGTSGATVTTGNSGGASGDAWSGVAINAGAVTYDNTRAHTGALSYKIVGATSGNNHLAWSLGTVTEAWGRVYLYLTGLPAANLGVIRLRSGSAQAARIDITTGGLIQLRNAADATIATGATAVATGQWVRLEWHVIAGTTGATLECRLYGDAASTTITETVSNTAAVLTANVTDVNYGAVASNPANTLWLDDLGASTSGWMGPLLPTVQISQITVTGNATSQARVRISQITVAGGATSQARVQLSAIWVTGVRPADADEATPWYVLRGGVLHPVYLYAARNGQLV